MWPELLIGAVKAGTQIYQGIKAQKEYQDQAADIKQQAELQKAQYYDQANKLSDQGNSLIGRQRTGFASAGVKLTEGSPLLVMRESQKAIQSDISKLRLMGDNALQTGMNQVKSAFDSGRNTMSASFLSAGNTLLGSLSNTGLFDPKKKDKKDEIWNDHSTYY